MGAEFTGRVNDDGYLAIGFFRDNFRKALRGSIVSMAGCRRVSQADFHGRKSRCVVAVAGSAGAAACISATGQQSKGQGQANSERYHSIPPHFSIPPIFVFTGYVNQNCRF